MQELNQWCVISKEPKLAPVDSPKRLSSSLLELNSVDKILSNNDISKSMISSESCKYINYIFFDRIWVSDNLQVKMQAQAETRCSACRI